MLIDTFTIYIPGFRHQAEDFPALLEIWNLRSRDLKARMEQYLLTKFSLTFDILIRFDEAYRQQGNVIAHNFGTWMARTGDEEWYTY